MFLLAEASVAFSLLFTPRRFPEVAACGGFIHMCQFRAFCLEISLALELSQSLLSSSGVFCPFWDA